MPSFLIFLICYSLMAVLCSVMIVGWYTITRGTEYKLPDGSTKHIGKIFMGWHFFFNKIVGQEPVHYKGEALWAKMDEIWGNIDWRHNWATLDKSDENRFIVPLDTMTFWSQNLDFFEKTFKVRALIRFNYVYLYQEMPIYRFPEWIRSPVSECINCMASVYGTIFYWFFVFVTRMQWPIVFFVGHKWSCEIGLWVMFCIIVSALNPIIFKKTV